MPEWHRLLSKDLLPASQAACRPKGTQAPAVPIPVRCVGPLASFLLGGPSLSVSGAMQPHLPFLPYKSGSPQSWVRMWLHGDFISHTIGKKEKKKKNLKSNSSFYLHPSSVTFKKCGKAGTVVHAFNPSTGEAEAGGAL